MDYLCGETMYEVIKKNKFTNSVQKDTIEILEILDTNCIFHGDPSPLNFMTDKNGVLFIIDFGFATHIDEKFIKKHNTTIPNVKLGIMFFILKTRKVFPEFKPKLLLKTVVDTLKLK
jgi:predicted unusual protein kinase regulating ubiquinone biosynthesis (AarF/ABC1/UbiB family)